MTENILRLPKTFRDSGGTIMSNSDHKVNESVAEMIKGESLYAGYPGWNFYGKVWWSEEQWHCEVWRYGSYSETYSADTLEEIMDEVSSEYGYE